MNICPVVDDKSNFLTAYIRYHYFARGKDEHVGYQKWLAEYGLRPGTKYLNFQPSLSDKYTRDIVAELDYDPFKSPWQKQ